MFTRFDVIENLNTKWYNNKSSATCPQCGVFGIQWEKQRGILNFTHERLGFLRIIMRELSACTQIPCFP